jgi:hypothetical protein
VRPWAWTPPSRDAETGIWTEMHRLRPDRDAIRRDTAGFSSRGKLLSSRDRPREDPCRSRLRPAKPE